MYLYRRVRDLREDHEKTQKQIASILNMQLTVFQRYERGELELTLWAAFKLADYFKVSTDSLLGRDKNMWLCVDGLTEEQIGHIRLLVQDLRG